MHKQIVFVRLTPKSSSNRIGDVRSLADGREVLTVYVTAPPDKNKANKAMIQLLSTHWGVAASAIQIINGHTQRIKTLSVVYEE
jgi:uncharacterized protein YggU (UPF0235/DUF167 family)